MKRKHDYNLYDTERDIACRKTDKLFTNILVFWNKTRAIDMKLLVPLRNHVDSLEKTQIPDLIKLIGLESELQN